MIINHNMLAQNSYRQLGINNANTAKTTEKLSSGLRINRAGDDAAGLAISEKMRGQIRGLDQASRNSQDGISMVQTAEGALNETHDILQRMRELATQAGNDTNVAVDRGEIQKEMNQLSSEINRIGNTTEFNTQSLLKGDGKANLTATGLVATGTLATGAAAYTTEAKRTDTISTIFANTDTLKYDINGQTLTVNFATDAAITTNTSKFNSSSTTATTATVGVNGTGGTTGPQTTEVAAALQAMIDKNDTLKGQYTAKVTGGNLVIEAVKGGTFAGAAGNIALNAGTTASRITPVGGSTNPGSNIAAVAATKSIDLSSITGTDAATTDANLKALVGKGFTVNDQQVEFYNSNDGAYTGSAIGVDISTALYESTYTNKDNALASAIASQVGSKIDGVKFTASTSNMVITATTAGTDGNNISFSDAGVQEQFKASFQVGANQGQSFTIDINDMRSAALGVTGKAGAAGFTAANAVTDGTNSTTKEAALDVSTSANASSAIKTINNAIEKVSAERSKLGAFQNRLEHTINNLNTSSENLTAAESRIRDTDMAKTVMANTKNGILAQAAQAMLAQANQAPQQVLQLLR